MNEARRRMKRTMYQINPVTNALDNNPRKRAIKVCTVKTLKFYL